MGLLQNPNLLFLNKNWAAMAIEGGAVTGITVADLKDGLTLTAAQMEAMLTYFRDNDMNGNGKTDEGDRFGAFAAANGCVAHGGQAPAAQVAQQRAGHIGLAHGCIRTDDEVICWHGVGGRLIIPAG